jgi:hypothetical protein
VTCSSCGIASIVLVVLVHAMSDGRRIEWSLCRNCYGAPLGIAR